MNTINPKLKNMTGTSIDFKQLRDTAKKTALKVRAINHPLRQKMLEYLDAHPETTVTDLYVHFRMEQSVASQHLAILRRAGYVVTRREGKKILYSVHEENIANVVVHFLRINKIREVAA